MGWDKACGDEQCEGCDATLEEGEDMYVQGDSVYCEGCNEDRLDDEAGEWDELDYMDREGDYPIDGVGFADPGGHSALRAATPNNPRDCDCPTCGAEDVLTRIDRQRGYQCDRCADRAEGRSGYGDY